MVQMDPQTGTHPWPRGLGPLVYTASSSLYEPYHFLSTRCYKWKNINPDQKQITHILYVHLYYSMQFDLKNNHDILVFWWGALVLKGLSGNIICICLCLALWLCSCFEVRIYCHLILSLIHVMM